MVVAAVFGGVAATGLAPFDLWPVALIALAGVVWCFDQTRTPGGAARIGWAAAAGYFAVGLQWIVSPFLVDVARHGWMAPFALFFMAGGLALFWALAFGLARWVSGPARGGFALIVLLTGAEVLRGTLFTGFPWNQPGHVLIASPLVPIAAWMGAEGLTLLTLALAAMLARVPSRPMAMVPVAALVGGLWLSAPALTTDVPPTPPDAPVLRLMQPNAPQDQKWDPQMMPVFLDRMLAYSAAAPAADVTIWPETSVPAFLDGAQGLLPVIGGQAQGALSVIGIERREGGRYYNSLATVAPDGSVGAVYDKYHLVPFGEYLPLGVVMGRLGLGPLAERFGGFTPGPGPMLVDLGPAGRALPLICYEAVFPGDVAAAPERPDLLLQITNDAWFGTFSGPYQHLAQARLRAIEQGLPMIRVANTGVSAAIAADGTVLATIPLGQAGMLDVPRPAAAAPTLFATIGPWPLRALLASIAILLFFARPGRRARD